MERYEPKQIEPKWQQVWEDAKAFETPNPEPDETGEESHWYQLEMLPYPSGTLHMGHVLNYTMGDVATHFRRRNGWTVLRPMGFDSFGLPAENAAITEGGHPREITERNIVAIRKQMQRLGWAIDWKREISAHEVDFYRWTQWLFLQFFERGLAYRAAAPVNWCPNDQTVVAHEYVVDGRCDRCGTLVEARNLEQWFFKITAYADELLEYELPEWGEWPERTKTIQRNWIGRSEGADILFRIEELDEDIPVFTTRPDTLFGATFFVVAPEHPLVERIGDDDVREYAKRTAARRGEARAAEETKTGVFTGHYVTNPVNGERLPVYVADYVLMEYGTGAIMAVPAHDERDREFAEAFDLTIREVIDEDGVLVDSGEFTGLPADEAKRRIVEWLGERGKGQPAVSYRLRDWSFSRQRYWGCPIPIVHCDDCGLVPVPEDELPLVAAGGRGLPAERRPAAGLQRGVDQCAVPEVREAGAARGRHDGHVRRLVLVLPALRRSPKRPGAVRPPPGRLLVPDLAVHRRDRPRDRAPALLALLHPGDEGDGARRASASRSRGCSTRGGCRWAARRCPSRRGTWRARILWSTSTGPTQCARTSSLWARPTRTWSGPTPGSRASSGSCGACGGSSTRSQSESPRGATYRTRRWRGRRTRRSRR